MLHLTRRRVGLEPREFAAGDGRGGAVGKAWGTDQHDQPATIFTPLARDELAGPRGEGYRRMIRLSPAGRGGTLDEVGAVAALLMGPGQQAGRELRLPLISTFDNVYERYRFSSRELPALAAELSLIRGHLREPLSEAARLAAGLVLEGIRSSRPVDVLIEGP